MGYGCRVGSLGNSPTPLGSCDPEGTVGPRYSYSVGPNCRLCFFPSRCVSFLPAVFLSCPLCFFPAVCVSFLPSVFLSCQLYFFPAGCVSFLPAVFLSVFTLLFSPSSFVYMSSLICAAPMCKCLRKHSCMSSTFPTYSQPH